MAQNNKEHDCIQERRLDRLENKTDNLDNKYEKILEILADNKAKLEVIINRLDKKKELDSERNGILHKEEDRIDTMEVKQAALDSQMVLLLRIIIGVAIILIAFVIEFQYKTMFLHI